jgi:hypothetical protein
MGRLIPVKTLALALIMALFSFIPERVSAEMKGNVKGDQEMVTYHYEAIPSDGNGKKEELVEIAVRDGEINREYLSKVITPETEERIQITVDGEGRFVSGKRTLADRSHSQLSSERIWLEGGKIYIEAKKEQGKQVRHHELPRDRVVAVDGSLLMLFRSFPFETGKEWQVYMVDFSGASVNATVRQAGRERVVVPAGDMECYRMEVVVNIPLLHPKITYWITAAKPHFLVKNEGKRGPFTPSYVTSLLSIEK